MDEEVKVQKFVKEAEKIANDDGIEISDEIRFEQKLIAYLTEFMYKHNYKINGNDSTRRIVIANIVDFSETHDSVEMDVFYYKLYRTGFLKKFGIKGHELLEKFINSRWFFDLPMLYEE